MVKSKDEGCENQNDVEIDLSDIKWVFLVMISIFSIALSSYGLIFGENGGASTALKAHASVLTGPGGGGGSGYPSIWGGEQYNFEWGWDNYANGTYAINANYQYEVTSNGNYAFISNNPGYSSYFYYNAYDMTYKMLSGGIFPPQPVPESVNGPYILTPYYSWDNVTVNGVHVQAVMVAMTIEFQATDIFDQVTDKIEIMENAYANGQLDGKIIPNSQSGVDWQNIVFLLEQLSGS
ncbi:MAG: hypothetical protein ACYDAP_10125 [Thermoplasmataceae archaeon]